jgi:hypothetical protein
MKRLFTTGFAVAIALFWAAGVQAGPPTGVKTHGSPHTPNTHANPNAKTHGGPKTTGGHGQSHSAVPRNPALVTRLQGMLPAGLSVENAAAGFKNQGQFIAAVHVSNNLGIPFGDLKTQMLGEGGSLGKAIHTLKPDADSDAEVEHATEQANHDLHN